MMNRVWHWLVKGGFFWLPLMVVVVIFTLLGSFSEPLWTLIFSPLGAEISRGLALLLTLAVFTLTGIIIEIKPVSTFLEKAKDLILRGRSNLKKNQGAFFEIYDGVYLLGLVTGSQQMRDIQGEKKEILCGTIPKELIKGYAPSSPLPWSGFPPIFARKDRVILLNLTFAEIAKIVTSFGKNSPEIMEYLTLNYSTKEAWIKRE